MSSTVVTPELEDALTFDCIRRMPTTPFYSPTKHRESRVLEEVYQSSQLDRQMQIAGVCRKKVLWLIENTPFCMGTWNCLFLTLLSSQIIKELQDYRAVDTQMMSTSWPIV